jgi:hypothetical protein
MTLVVRHADPLRQGTPGAGVVLQTDAVDRQMKRVNGGR